MPYRLKRGSWQPARHKRVDHQIILISLVVIAFVRGFDYLLGNDTWGARDFMLAAAPEWVWAWGFILGATLLTAGMLRRAHLLVYVGHGWLGVAYGVNALALGLGSDPPWMDGIRGMGSTGLVALVHWIYCVRTGSRPLRLDRTVTPTEILVEGDK